MDNDAFQALVVFFVFCLPLSLFLWTALVGWSGILCDVDDQPGWFQAVIGRISTNGAERSVVGAACAIGFLAVANFAPLGVLIHNPYGPQSLAVDLAYFAVQAICMIPLALAVARALRRRHDQ
jgi:hypothetical protein